MPTQMVWKCFGRFTRWSENLWTPPIVFDERSRQFQIPFNKGRPYLYSWWLSSAIVVLTGVIMVVVLLKNIFSPHSSYTALEAIFSVFYIAFALLILVLAHCSIVLRAQMIAALNQLLILDTTLCKWGFADARGWDSVSLLMHGFLVISNVTPLLLAVFGVYEMIDAPYIFLVNFLPRSVLRSSGLLSLLRFSWLLVTLTEVWKQIGFFSLSCLLVLQIVSKALGIKTNPANLMRYGLAGKRRLQIQWRFNQAYVIYRKLQLIIFGGINPSIYFFMPYLMAFGLVLCILADFTTIVLHYRMNAFLLIVMPCISFGVKFIIITMLPQACQVNHESCKFKEEWVKLAPIGNRLSRRKLWALLPLRFYAGPFFYCKKSTKTTYFSVLIHYTMSAVISVNKDI